MPDSDSMLASRKGGRGIGWEGATQKQVRQEKGKQEETKGKQRTRKGNKTRNSSDGGTLAGEQGESAPRDHPVGKMLHDRLGLDSACRHKMKFCRFKSGNTKASTDDGAKPERVSVQSHNFGAQAKNQAIGLNGLGNGTNLVNHLWTNVVWHAMHQAVVQS